MAKWQLIVPALLGGSVVAGGAAAYFYFKGIPAQVGIDPAASAAIVPDEALMAGFISGDEQAWSKLKKFGTPEAQKLFTDGFESFTSSFEKSEQNIDVEKDVLPWVGNVMMALIPVKNSEPQPLMVVGIKDKLAALNFANKMKEEAKSTIKEQDYKGVKVLENTKDASFLAVLEHHLVMTQDRKTIELAIDTSKGAPSLKSKAAAVKDVFDGFENPVAQVYIPDYGALFQQFAKASDTPVPPQFVNQLNQVESVVFGMGTNAKGLEIRAITKMNPDAPQWAYKPMPGKVIAEFPDNTMALVSGGDINQSWTTSAEQLSKIPEFRQTLEQTRKQLRQFTQLDLDKDILGWMDGEFALGLIPSQEGMLADLGFGGALLFETSDRTTAEKTFGKLDTLATRNLLQLNQRDIGSTKVTEWQVPVQGTLVSHGWLDQDTTFMALGGPMADILAAQPDKTLNNSKVFQEVTQDLPKENSGYFYLNMEQASGMLTRNPLVAQSGWFTPETKAMLDSIRAIGATTSQVNNSTLQTDIVMTLQSTKK